MYRIVRKGLYGGIWKKKTFKISIYSPKYSVITEAKLEIIWSNGLFHKLGTLSILGSEKWIQVGKGDPNLKGEIPNLPCFLVDKS